MPVTTTTDLHYLEQLGDNVTEILFAQVPLLAIPGLVRDVDGKIADAGGEKIVFTRWNTDISGVTQDSVRNSRVGVAPSKLSLDSYTEDAVAKTISFDGDTFAMDDASENTDSAIEKIVAMEFAKHIQSKLIAQAVDTTEVSGVPKGTNLSLDVTGTSGAMTVDGLLEARLKWEEHASGLNPVAFIHTAQFLSLAKTEDYKKLAVNNGSAIARQEADWNNFVVSYVHGMPIVLCDSLPKTAAIEDPETPATYTALLVAQDAFGVYVSNAPKVNVINHPGSTVKTIDTHWRWASTFYRHAPRRVVKFITI